MILSSPLRLLVKILIVVGAGIAIGSCGSSADDIVATESQAPDSPESGLECELENYPCSIAEVPYEILERSSVLSQLVATMYEDGDSPADIAGFLGDQEDMVDVTIDDGGVRFRIEGGRGTWVIPEAAVATRGAPTPGSPGSALLGSFEPQARVVAPNVPLKKAIVLSPMRWNFRHLDDGPTVRGILAETQGYDHAEGVKFEENASSADTNVSLDDFKGWDEFDLIHVVSHGTRICDKDKCQAVISSQLLRGCPPGGTGVQVHRAEALRRFVDRGVELATVAGRGLRVVTDESAPGSQRPGDTEPGPEDDPSNWICANNRIELVFLTAEFFAEQYPDGLEDTLIFLNSCRTLGGEATDLAETLLGEGSVYLGWTDWVRNPVAFAAAESLYNEMARGGWPVELAYDQLGDLAFDPKNESLLVLGKLGTGDGLRIREVVELLHPVSEERMKPLNVVEIVGTINDGQTDSIPFRVRVDAIGPDDAVQLPLHISVDGQLRSDMLVSSGVMHAESWTVTGVIDLGFDVIDGQEVTLHAWLDLPDGGRSSHEVEVTLVGELSPHRFMDVSDFEPNESLKITYEYLQGGYVSSKVVVAWSGKNISKTFFDTDLNGFLDEPSDYRWVRGPDVGFEGFCDIGPGGRGCSPLGTAATEEGTSALFPGGFGEIPRFQGALPGFEVLEPRLYAGRECSFGVGVDDDFGEVELCIDELTEAVLYLHTIGRCNDPDLSDRSCVEVQATFVDDADLRDIDGPTLGDFELPAP